MFNYTSINQLDIFDFKTDFESKLDPNNRWVKLAKLLDWDSFAAIYSNTLSTTTGAGSVDARVVIGAMIIKHLENKDDRGTIEIIQENPYMQFFLGFDHFHFKPVFDPSLFVHIRKRLGGEEFDKMNQLVIAKALEAEKGSMAIDDDQTGDSSDNQTVNEADKPKPQTNRGKLQLDATVCDAYISYPTDLNLLNDARQKSEQIIDKLCEALGIEKPRTYRIVAKKEWLNLAKSKTNTKKKLRAGIRKQLSYLRRNLKSIDKIIDPDPAKLKHLGKSLYRYLLIIKELYRQQQAMYDQKANRINDRIVSIHQPHVRPIVRGKKGKKKVEFGAKINISLQNGYATIDQFSFDNFNEGGYLQEQINKYKKQHGYYPELVQSDGIYMTQENRKFLKEKNIRHTGKPLGRKPKEKLSKQAQKIQKIERAERNHIEGKFGQGKVKYGLNRIMAKLTTTSESWVAAILFVLNILKLNKDIFMPFVNELKIGEYQHGYNPNLSLNKYKMVA